MEYEKNTMYLTFFTSAKKTGCFSTNPQRDFYDVYKVPLMFLHNYNIL